MELAKSGSVDLILGGHDHEVMEVRPEGGAPIIKSGSDAKIAAVLDIELGPSRALTVSVAFEPVEGFAADPEVQAEVDSHLAVIRALEKEPMCSLKDSEVLERQQAAADAQAMLLWGSELLRRSAAGSLERADEYLVAALAYKCASACAMCVLLSREMAERWPRDMAER